MKRVSLLVFFVALSLFASGCTYIPEARWPGEPSEYYKGPPPPAAKKYTIERVVIDPGHGGKDPGATGRGGLKEKTIVLDIAQRLSRRLEGRGIDITITRNSDTFISLWSRANIANKRDADFFISIHANAARSRRAQGFEVYYLSEATDDSARALAQVENASLEYEDSSVDKYTTDLEATLWDLELTENRVESIELAKIVSNEACDILGCKERGVKSARFYVLKHSRCPAILVEVGFVTNKNEEMKLKDAAYRDKIAEGLAEGILAYRREFERTNGFTN
ncbi:MAG: N-acetylmuramoyl-L-alanine amidase [Candidatus Omnitrophica bacterium]|nr:N-acetylmuramoyl-L-alanine amidase [Candidatus Omnitrophota bacterium]